MALQQVIVSHAGTYTKQFYFCLTTWTQIKVFLKQKNHHSLFAASLSDMGKAKLLQQEKWFACHSNPSASLKGQATSFRHQSAGMVLLLWGKANKLSQNVLHGYFRKGEITREMTVESIITAHEVSCSLFCSEGCVMPFSTYTHCQQLCVTMGPHVVSKVLVSGFVYISSIFLPIRSIHHLYSD